MQSVDTDRLVDPVRQGLIFSVRGENSKSWTLTVGAPAPAAGTIWLVPERTAVQPESATAPAPLGAPVIELRGLRRDYGERTALREVSLQLEPGQTLAVLGPNGAGKTTLLRVLATLLRPTAGKVNVLGCALPREAWRVRGRVGYLGHEPLLYRDLTIRENLRFNARLHALPADGEERITRLLELAGLASRADDLVRDLSAGLVQRAAACRAVLHEPELILLDEPRSHLDPDAAGQLEPMLGAAPNRSRVLVTHEVELGLSEADRVLALRRDGSVAFEGPASRLSPGDARAIYGRST